MTGGWVRGTVALWAMGGLACASELSAPEVAQTVRDYFTAQDVVVSEVTCAHGLVRRRGEQVRCDVQVDSLTIAVAAEVSDEAGNVVVVPEQAALITAKLEPEIAQSVAAHGHVVTDVHCDGALWLAEPGTEHRCEVTVDDGRRFAWLGVFSGQGTEHRARLVPLSVPGAAL